MPAEPGPNGTVATTRKRRRRRIVGWVVLVALALVLAALGAAQLLRTPSYTVPDLVGRPAGEVANLVAEFDWTLEVQRSRSDDVAVDAVISTDPPAGTSLKRGSTLVVVLSEGPTTVVVVDVTGLAVQDAFAQLRQQGLVPVVTAARPDEDVPADVVLRWFVADQPTLASDAEVVKGTEIAIEVSQGPEPREVPDVVGRSSSSAQRLLADRGLVAELAEDFSDTAPVGEVVAQSPLPGMVVARDSSVLVVLSKGPDVVTVPDLEGLDPDGVEAALASADLVLGAVTGDTGRRLLGLSVDGAAVRSGDQVRRGSTVSLVYEFAP